MKEIILSIAKALAELGQREVSSELDRIARALVESKVKNIDVISLALPRKSLVQRAAADVNLGSLVPVLSAFYAVLLDAGAKKKNIDDVKALLDLFGEYRNLSVDEFCQALCAKTIGKPAVDHQLVDTYLVRLEKVLGDEQKFPLLYEALTADRRIAQPEAVELASRFLAPVAKSTSRPKALRRVLYRHEKLIKSRAASASIAARR